LLRYDGYYILSDLIEIPNLAQRGQKYLSYWWDSTVFGARDIETPQETPSEKRWLLIYTPLAWCYRTVVTVSIMLFVADRFFIFGVLIALWVAVTLIGQPLWKAYRHVTRSPTLRRQRQRAIRIASGLAAAALLITFALPAPLYTRAEGVVWLPDQALLRAGGNGFFRRWLITPGTRVHPGDALFVLEDTELATQLAVALAKVAEAEARYRSEQFVDQAKAALSHRQLQQEQAILSQLQQRAAKLIAYAQTDGYLIVVQPKDMPDRYLKQGELAGYVLEKDHLIARVIIGQDDIDLVRSHLQGAELRFADWIGRSHSVTLVQQPAGGIDQLPTPALGLTGGGSIATAPDDPEGLKTLNRVFAADLSLPGDTPPTAFGERVYVRFDHGLEPMAWQGLRRLRQLFLSRFGV
jgi:putative peptide zinc metalloprotease protein